MRTASPRAVGGANTGYLYVYVEDVEAHHSTASGEGAEVLGAPADQSWGDRAYRAADLEGHVWRFASVVR